MQNQDELPIIPTSISGMYCPQCQYDLRGLTTNLCPECGQMFTIEAVLKAALKWRYDNLFRWLMLIPVIWFGLYFLAIPELSKTVDKTHAFWIKALLLNIPLQVVVAGVAWACLNSLKKATRKFGAAAACVEFFLILGHVGLTVASSLPA